MGPACAGTLGLLIHMRGSLETPLHHAQWEAAARERDAPWQTQAPGSGTGEVSPSLKGRPAADITTVTARAPVESGRSAWGPERAGNGRPWNGFLKGLLQSVDRMRGIKMGLPDLANKQTGCQVKFKLHFNNESYF